MILRPSHAVLHVCVVGFTKLIELLQISDDFHMVGSDVVKLTGYKKRSPECDGDVLETPDTTPDVNEDFPDGGPQENEVRNPEIIHFSSHSITA